MDDTIRKFLQESPIAKKVIMEPRVVLRREQYTTGKLASFKHQKELPPLSQQSVINELQVDGQVIARGKIIKKKGEYYFKISELLDSDEEKV